MSGINRETDDETFLSSNSSEFYPIYIRRRRARSSSSTQNRKCNLVKRLVRKSGKSSTYQKSFPRRLYRYLLDLSNTLINCHWKWTLLTLSLAFILTWFMFACLWMIIAIDNDDLGENNDPEFQPCLGGIHSFAGYLLFSIETQSTIGYGNRYINHHCPQAIFLLCVQILTGICICGSLVSIVYAKMIGPNRLHSMNCFSKFAVICQRDGYLCLVFRIRDYSGRYECHTKITAYLVQKRRDELFLKSINLDPPGILIWPVEVVHKINETSPFWDLSAKDLIIKRFELVVTLEGVSSSTSKISRTRTSYVSAEILWGHKFRPCIKYSRTKNCYIVNQKLFNKTEEMLSPLCSSKRLFEVFEDMSSTSQYTTSEATSSPLFNDFKIFQPCLEHGEEEDSTSLMFKNILVHPIPEKFMNRESYDTNLSTEDDLTDGDSSYSSMDDEPSDDEFVCDGTCSTQVVSHHKINCKCLEDVQHLYQSLAYFVQKDNDAHCPSHADSKEYIETAF